jgi:four helix bundle protein
MMPIKNYQDLTHGSLRELETQVLLSHRLGFLKWHDRDELMSGASEVGTLITGLANSLG